MVTQLANVGRVITGPRLKSVTRNDEERCTCGPPGRGCLSNFPIDRRGPLSLDLRATGLHDPWLEHELRRAQRGFQASEKWSPWPFHSHSWQTLNRPLTHPRRRDRRGEGAGLWVHRRAPAGTNRPLCDPVRLGSRPEGTKRPFCDPFGYRCDRSSHMCAAPGQQGADRAPSPVARRFRNSASSGTLSSWTRKKRMRPNGVLWRAPERAPENSVGARVRAESPPESP